MKIETEDKAEDPRIGNFGFLFLDYLKHYCSPCNFRKWSPAAYGGRVHTAPVPASLVTFANPFQLDTGQKSLYHRPMSTNTGRSANPSGAVAASGGGAEGTDGTPDKERKISKDYRDDMADVELVSSDDVVFKVHSYQLMAARCVLPALTYPLAFADF